MVGLDDAIKEIKVALLDQLLHTQHHQHIQQIFDLQPTRNILLYGPSGSGKTALAIAVAQQSHVNTIYIEATTIISKLVGQSEKNLRALIILFTCIRVFSVCIFWNSFYCVCPSFICFSV